VPNPFGSDHASYAAHNNALLRQFLDSFGFDYEFLASSECYRGGRFDETLRAILRNYDKIMGVMLPTLGEERRKTYSPVLPISPRSGKVLQVAIEVLDPEAGLVAFDDEGERTEQSILSGGAKLQWKVDWAMRWVALGVDYEMAGKDLIDSVTQSSKIARILGARPPEGFNYELFLDENGEKISKSKGNGVTLDEWLRYGPQESLTFYLYREPRRAKQLSFGVIPRAIDEYQQFLAAYPNQPVEQQLGNPVHHIHGGNPPQARVPLTFALLLNLVGVASTDDKELLWGFVQRYVPGVAPDTHKEVDALIDHALVYFRDFVAGRSSAGRRRIPRRPPCATSTGASRLCRTPPMRRPSRTKFTKSARPTRSKTCATGSRRSTRPCSAPARAPEWAASSPSTASPTPQADR
jgi:lysyl-tRNA synthetase class 1